MFLSDLIDYEPRLNRLTFPIEWTAMTTTIRHYTDLGEFTYGACDQVSPLIRRVICDNPSPFTYKGTGTYLVGEGDVAVIDPGPLLDSHLDNLITALGPGEQITAAFVTHTHSDHSPLTGLLCERTGAISYGFGPHVDFDDDDPDDRIDFSGYISEAEQAQFQREYDELPDELKGESADSDFVPDVMLCDGDIVAGDGWRLRAIHTPGHTSNHLCFELMEEKALFSGDHVMGWATSVIAPPDGSMQDYLASLQKLLDYDHDRYWPTHGPPIPSPHEYVRSFIAHRTQREASIIEFLRVGPSRIADFVPKMYEGYDKRLWYPAAKSVFAHMIHLVETGQVRVAHNDGDNNGQAGDNGGQVSKTPKLTSMYELTEHATTEAV